MKEKGFTLIELLAVIVILAIIALIAVPIILNIIDDSKESSNKRSIELYAKAVENAVGNYQLKNPQDKDITLEKIEEYIEYKGNKVECSTTEINEDGTIYLSDCKVNGKEVEYAYGVDRRIFKPATESNKTVAGNVPQGNYAKGDEYIINVDGTNEYHFYVLSTEGEKVNLIMSRNICSDGTLATYNNRCLEPWASKIDYNASPGVGTYGNSGTNDKGPITAMNYLYETTKNWNNIENIVMDYTDEGNTGEYGYGTIKTNGNTTTITMKDGTVTATYNNLKARLAKISEITATGCANSNGSCPAWMVNGLSHYKDKYPEGTKENISAIGGYWSLSSGFSYLYRAGAVRSYGSVNDVDILNAADRSDYGLRPVIEILKSDLS